MIFVTIGTQGPFDRLIAVMDEIAALIPETPVIAQISESSYKVKNMKTFEFLTPLEFNKYFSEASLIVSHAGMGTIISALQQEKPIIIFPKLVKFKEHRNDHQMATAKKFEALKYVHVAYDVETLKEKVLSAAKGELQSMHKLGDNASPELINSLRQFVTAR